MRNALVHCLLAGLIGLAGIFGSAQAAESKAYSVLIGVSHYADSAIEARKHAETDALAMYEVFNNKEYFKDGSQEVRLLLGNDSGHGKAVKATKANILSALEWAFNSATESDRVIIYWAGQGGPCGENTCYFAADTTVKSRDETALPADEIKTLINESATRDICFMLDVNFNSLSDSKEKVSDTGLEQLFEEFSGRNDEGERRLPKPIMYICATDGLSAAPDLEQKGLFADVVLQGIKGSADKDKDGGDGVVTANELFRWIREQMPQRVKALTEKQGFAVSSLYAEDFQISRNPEPAVKFEGLIEKLSALETAEKISKEIAEEGRTLLSQMPSIKKDQELREKYIQLADGGMEVKDFLKARSEHMDELKLPRDEAEQFAKNVLRVARIAKLQYVRPVTEGKMVKAAVRGLFRRARVSIPTEMKARLRKVEELKREELRDLLADAREKIGNREDLKGQKAVDFALATMLHSLDDYSQYIDPEQRAEFERMTKQFFIGVGIQINKLDARGPIHVATPLYGSPAYHAGIQTGDLITKITNTVDKEGNKLSEPEETLTKDLTTNQAVKVILGKRGTPVQLTVVRKGQEEPIEFTINRGSVQVETVTGAKRNDDDSWDFYIDEANQIGYIRLTQFAYNTVRDLQRAIEDLQKEGVKGLILDLRFNPGGYLDAAVRVSNLFIEDGLIVEIRPRKGRSHSFRAQSKGTLPGFPLVVLINKGSASASEIVSACIQDHNRGIVMGERSFGKGSVQNIMRINLGEGDSEVKLTTASFWRPNKKNLNRFPGSKADDDWGVQPHKKYTHNMGPIERGKLRQHMEELQVIYPKGVKREVKDPEFMDRQLDSAVGYLQKLVAPRKAASRKAG